MKTSIQNVVVSLDHVKRYAKDHFHWRGDILAESDNKMYQKNYFIVVHHIEIEGKDQYLVTFSMDMNRMEDLHDEENDADSDFTMIQTIEDVIYMFSHNSYTGYKFIEKQVIQDTDLGF
ncbi:hypothetical protein COF68_05715 [Bacillus toyonensis]|uniref:hypothetical protein n=1 Tax=Bacillus toyonensis TaxID=155322 RepID=UPI000BFC38C5|nr:hypothetical protein [Bacillus toyonensis]PHE64337.1 hypothetical protein COF68_05715 [Bacillus toyonensis]